MCEVDVFNNTDSVMNSHENMSSLDVRIHHRICVVKKHLLHTHVRLKEKFIENYLINVPIQKDAGNALNIYFIEFCL